MSETFNQVVQRWSDELVMYDEYDGDRLREALAAAGWRLERNRVEFGVRYASGKTSPDGHRHRGTAEFIVQECPGSRLIQRTAGVPAGPWEVAPDA